MRCSRKSQRKPKSYALTVETDLTNIVLMPTVKSARATHDVLACYTHQRYLVISQRQKVQK